MEEKKLWEISSELESTINELNELQGEISEEKEKLLNDLQAMLETKTSSCIDYLDYLKTMVGIAKSKRETINDYIKATENKVENYKNYMINCFERIGTNKIENDLFTLSINKQRKVVNVFNEDAIPPEYTQVERKIKISKADLLTDLKNGVDIPGAELVDSDNKSLSIRFKK
jgi:uncharacterized coiled-coil DUF342 family protein